MPTNDQGDSDSGGVRSVQRAVEIMSLLTEQRPTVTIREVVEATGLPKTTVLRIVGDAGAQWPALGHPERLRCRTWPVAMGPPGQEELGAAGGTRALMRELVARQRETVNIYVIHNVARVCVAQEESPMSLRHVVHVGDELPLWAGASSKVLLRDARGDLLEQIVRSAPEECRAPVAAPGRDCRRYPRWLRGQSRRARSRSGGRRRTDLGEERRSRRVALLQRPYEQVSARSNSGADRGPAMGRPAAHGARFRPPAAGDPWCSAG